MDGKTGKEAGRTLFLVSIFVINFISLVYQVVWTRKIMVIFGTTALSISTTLTVFLSGIALGGYLGSRWIERVRRKYLFCGALLVALGVYCLGSVYFFGLVKYPFHYFVRITGSAMSVNAFKMILCYVILIFPTTVIGMMFPIVTYLYSREFKDLGRDIGSIYFLDTLGAAIGAALCGFYFVPVMGLALTSAVSAAAYVVLGLVIMRYGRNESFADAPEPLRPVSDKPGDNASPGLRVLILGVLFLSGFAALLLEVTWSRYFHLLFGTSIYAFSLVVAAFLLGISAGSMIISRFLDRLKNPLLAFAYIEIFIAGTSLLTIYTSGWVEVYYFKFFKQILNFYAFHGLLLGAAFLLMLIPTALMGANFPLAVKILGRREKKGTDVGVTFSINTAGGIIGAFAAGFLIIPVLGLEKTSILASVIYLAIGVTFLLFSSRRIVLHSSAAACFVLPVAVIGFLNHGEPDLNYSVYYNGVNQHKSVEDFKDFKNRIQTLYSRHGYYGLVTVNYDPRQKNIFLLNNGKVDASTEIGDMQMQLMLGHMPFFLHQAPNRVLNIGLGGGFTLGAMTGHPNIKSIDMIEIDPLVVEATANYFSQYNNNALADPRVKMHIQDGRHFLETTSKKYDVIVSEPPNIWVSGVSQLFTREFYELADEHMKPGAILAQWVPLYEMNDEDLKLILRTVKERFRYVAFWTNNIDVIILASHERPVLNPDYSGRLMEVDQIYEDLEKITTGISAEQMNRFILNPNVSYSAMDDFIRGVENINTDNLPFLEFRTARNMFDLAHISR